MSSAKLLFPCLLLTHHVSLYSGLFQIIGIVTVTHGTNGLSVGWHFPTGTLPQPTRDIYPHGSRYPWQSLPINHFCVSSQALRSCHQYHHAAQHGTGGRNGSGCAWSSAETSPEEYVSNYTRSRLQYPCLWLPVVFILTSVLPLYLFVFILSLTLHWLLSVVSTKPDWE